MKTNDLDYNLASELFEYDELTGKLTWKVSRANNKVKVGDEAGCAQTDPSGKSYMRVTINRKKYYCHRIIWLLKTGKMPEDQIDHIDGNGLNNRWLNLRAVSLKANRKNLRKQSNNTSGTTGVHWHKPSKKWRVFIYINGKQTHLGYFNDIGEAIKVRKAAEIEYNYHENHGTERPL